MSANDLCNTLEQIVTLLDSVQENHWKDWMQRARDLLAQGNMRGVDLLLRAYGGMGSFNDFIINAHETVDGAWVVNSERIKRNEELDTLRTKAWLQAKEIRQARTFLESIQLASPSEIKWGLSRFFLLS